MTVNIDITDLMVKLNNIVEYTEGFLVEVQKERVAFNKALGNHIVTLLGQYIDSVARVSPESLHHVYEWGQVGDESGRLFDFNMVATDSSIKLIGNFLESSSVGPTATEPFVDKARVMERGIEVVIEPKNAEALVFEDDGETVFVTTSVTVEHPGGEAVVGSFESAVESFFTTYVSKEILRPLLNKMSRAREYKRLFSAGARSGRRAGQQAARRYMNVGGLNGLA